MEKEPKKKPNPLTLAHDSFDAVDSTLKELQIGKNEYKARIDVIVNGLHACENHATLQISLDQIYYYDSDNTNKTRARNWKRFRAVVLGTAEAAYSLAEHRAHCAAATHLANNSQSNYSLSQTHALAFTNAAINKINVKDHDDRMYKLKKKRDKK